MLGVLSQVGRGIIHSCSLSPDSVEGRGNNKGLPDASGQGTFHGGELPGGKGPHVFNVLSWSPHLSF